jgi:hypothetical protein
MQFIYKYFLGPRAQFPAHKFTHLSSQCQRGHAPETKVDFCFQCATITYQFKFLILLGMQGLHLENILNLP